MATSAVRPVARLAAVVAMTFAPMAPAGAQAPALEEAVAWLKSLNVPLADAKGFVAPSAESLPEVRWASFARVPAGRLVTADLAKLAALPKLDEIVFGGNAASDAGVAEIAKAKPGLRRLWLFRSAVTDAAFAHVGGMAELEALHLAGTRISAAAMVQVAKLRKLRILDLDETAVGDAGLAALRALPSLSEISFQGMRGVTAAGLGSLAALRRLDTLNLSFADIAAIEVLGGSRSLRELQLQRSTIDDSKAVGLAKLKTLRALSLAHTGIGDAAMPAVAELPTLFALNLTDTKITDDGVKSLAQMKTLVDLDLSGTAVGDAGIEHLKGLPKLASLILRGTKLTDAGLEKLAAMESLANLDVTDTAVTAAAAAKLVAARPKLLVAHSP